MLQLFSETNLLITRKTLLAIISFNSFLSFSETLNAQTSVVTDSPFIKGTTVVIPGPEFKRSGYHNFWYGKHYRKEWAAPVRVKNFYLDTAAGGLIPIQESGSRQTQGLRLKNSNGKEYVLRSVDKDFGKAFPDNFQGTFITRIAKDQASIAQPFAAITITPMIEATGIYHTNPQIVFVPSQNALDKYNKKYGDQLYLFEERPDDNQQDADYFGHSKNLIGSDKLFEHIYDDNDDRVDQKAFAKARLFDMFIGDWSRHPDNWRWAKFEEDDSSQKGKINIYKPVPRDRDQAYTTFDGFWPWVSTNIFGAIELESFDRDLNNVKRFNKPAWPLDRPFTNELTEQDWINVATELQRELTDSVIEAGVHQMPQEIFSISGNSIIAKLKSRRDHLQDYAKRYYEFLAHHVELRGSNEKELFEIKRLNNKETQINIYKIKKDHEVKDQPYYSRMFNYNETKEIRLYSLGDSDVIKETGELHGVKVRVIDPEGTDSISRESKNRTKLSAGKKFRFDTLHTKKFDFFVIPLFSPPEYKVLENDPMGLFPKTGVRISANARYLSQPWRTSQYMNTHLISVNYGFLRTALNMGYVGRFGHLVGPFDLLIKAKIDPRAIQNYFGTGNETIDTITTRNYYRTITSRFYSGLGLSAIFHRYQSFDLTGFYQTIKLKDAGGYFSTNDHKIDSSLFNSNQYAGIEAVYRYRKANSVFYPTSGVDFSLAAAYIDNIPQAGHSFTNVSSSFAAYIPLSKSFTLASRAGGAILSGDADFYHLNRLDASTNLRGYVRERFAGKATFYNNNELRWVTNTKNYFFNGQAGLFIFYDQGRVWQPLEKSNKWHDGYGAGVILIPFNRAALTGTYCRSVEGDFIQLKATTFF